MKYKIKILAIDELLEDVEYIIDFMFLDSNIKYQAWLQSGISAIVRSFLGKEVTADLELDTDSCHPTLDSCSCKQNKEKKTNWLSSIYNRDDNTYTWVSPADITKIKDLSSRYIFSGKVLDVIIDESGSKYYRLQSERTIDVSDFDCYIIDENNHWKLDNTKRDNILGV